MYRLVEIPGGGRSDSSRKVSSYLEDALVALGKAMHYAEAGGDEGYYSRRDPMMHEGDMQIPSRYMQEGMNMRHEKMNYREGEEHSEEYLRGWNDHAQMMGMRTRMMRHY